MVQINGERLITTLRELRQFGAVGTGVVRQMFSDVDIESRHWLVEQMEAAGLSAKIDGVGNVYGRTRNDGPAVVIGSHSDTQPEGGWLDGAMGVMYGIEVARALRDDPSTRHLAVDVASWADEEGTYTSLLGSRSFVGDFPDAALDDAAAHGETVRQALDRLALTSVVRVRLEPDRHIGYLEAHIEQGPHLEATGKRIGVVTSIVGIRSMQITFIGEQNHAGSTPMHMRKDAGVAMFDFGVRVRERLMALAGPTTVWTIGNGRLLPGGESIIPGEAWCGLQFRDPSDDVMESFQTAVSELAAEMTAEGPVAVSAELRRDPMPPAAMDAELRRHLSVAAETHVPGEWVDMPSAAIHDANVLSEHVSSAMLFVPSINGVSHDFAEDTSDLDIITGCQVLATASAAILSS
jgi:N-carbamoyl-L-amino-acid hydrolase